MTPKSVGQSVRGRGAGTASKNLLRGATATPGKAEVTDKTPADSAEPRAAGAVSRDNMQTPMRRGVPTWTEPRFRGGSAQTPDSLQP